ncbi:recombinase family protein [Clostridium botulinum]|uniref:recombinase family protein n=1 Tax=Clostridium botulinum TaxID=1491 RepID=UPI00217D77C4|nr:recombinase family protein [Clostridium botulinum]
MEMLKNVVAYCRVSTNKKEQKESFEHQKSYFERELSKEKGYNLLNIYADEGISGTSFKKRDSFNKMLEECGIIKKMSSLNANETRNRYIEVEYNINPAVKPKFTTIFCKNTSRFARNTEVNKILRMLKQQGVGVQFIDLNMNSINDGDLTTLEIMASIDARESRDRSNKVKFGANETAKQGKIRCGKELYGYNIDFNTNTLKAIKEEAEIVKLIFKLRLEGMGIRKIRKELDSKDITTRRGKSFGETTLSNMLKNPIYIGKVCRNKYSRDFVSKSLIKKDESEWIIKDTNRIEKIVDEETFNKVQRLAKDSKDANGKGIFRGYTKLAKKIICGNCGKYYTKNSNRGLIFYNCTNKKKNGKSVCNSKNIREEVFNNLIKFFTQNGQYKKTTKNFINTIIKEMEKEKTLLEKKIDNDEVLEIKKQLKQHESVLEEMLNSLLDKNNSATSIRIFNKKKEEIEEKIKVLEDKIKILTIDDKEKEFKLSKINDIIKALEEEYKIIPEVITEEDFIEKYLIYFLVCEENVKVFTKSHLLVLELNKILKNKKLEKVIG